MAGLRSHLANVIPAVGEFPVRGHRVRFQSVHDRDHVLSLGLIGRIAALPSITAIEQQARKDDPPEHA